MKIAVISAAKAKLEQVRNALSTAEAQHRTLLLRQGGVDQIGPVADQETPDLMILDELILRPADLSVLETPAKRHPNIAFILIGENPSNELLIAAMHVGVRDVLGTPINAFALNAAVNLVEQKLQANRAPLSKGAVIAFIACKGGSGATFLASNVAYMLAKEYGKKVALFDLNLNGGDASLFVSDRVPGSTLGDVAHNIARLDAAYLQASMLAVLTNFSVLASPESMEGAIEITPEHVESVIKIAESEYDFIVLDVGRSLGRVGVRALDRADLIFPVLQLTLPFIRDAKRLLSTLQSLGYTQSHIRLIVNRYEGGGDIQLADVERTLGRKVDLSIPNSFKAVSASVNQGVPIVNVDSHNAVTKSLRSLVEQFLVGESKEGGGWLSRLFRRSA
jgi:pilus assembly protein CpaE